jgi:NitT/TauT family transport system ATP-binding protein
LDTPFVYVNNLNFGYLKGSIVLDNISFNLNKGDTLGILGISGSGKSTLLRLLSGIIINDKNNTLFGQIQIDGLEPKAYRKLGKLSFMFQKPALMPNLTVKENILLPLKIRKSDINNDVLNDIIETVGLTDFQEYLPNRLSGGMVARVELARSFIIGPDLLMLDEPFSSLDVGWKAKIFDEFKLLESKYKTTSIIVTHEISEAMELSDSLIILSAKGKILNVYDLNKKKPDTDIFIDIKKHIIEDHNQNYNDE